jgi:hypothetical protein
VASLIYMITPVVLFCSALIGIGAALLWTSQGMMMSMSTTDANKASYYSMFWGIFNLCGALPALSAKAPLATNCSKQKQHL